MTKTLVLSAGMEPIRIAPWEDAMTLVVKGSAEVLEEYEQPVALMSEKLIQSYRAFMKAMHKTIDDIVDGVLTIRMPSVIRLVRFFRRGMKKAKFSRINVFTRDKFQCQYCGKKYQMKHAFKHLTYDHVVPRHRGGKTTWTNIVTACRECNAKKANMTVDECNMHPMRKPVQPGHLPLTFYCDLMGGMPESWKLYLGWE